MHAAGTPKGRGTAAGRHPIESAAALLKELRPLALVQEVPGAMSATAGTADQQLQHCPRYTMHNLVREIAADLLYSSREQRLGSYTAFIEFILVQGEALHSCRMGEDQEAFIQLLSNEQMNMAEVARVLLKLSAEVVMVPQTLRSCERLADNLFACGMWQLAVPLLHVVVRLQERALGPNCLLSCRTSLAFQLMRVGKVQEAEALGQKMLALTEQAYGANNAQTLRAQLNLAEIEVCRGEVQRAEALCREVLSACHEELGPGIVLSAQLLLGACLCRRGALKGAKEGIGQVCLLDLAGVDERDYQIVFASRAHLVCALRRSGDLEAAENMQRELLSAMEHAFGNQAGNRLDVNIAKVRLAAILAVAGKLKEASQCMRQALKRRELLLGQLMPGRIEDAHMRASLGAMLARCADTELADIMLRWAVGPYADELGPAHPEALKARQKMAMVLQMCGSWKKRSTQHA